MKTRTVRVHRGGCGLIFATITQTWGKRRTCSTYSVLRFPSEGPALTYSFGKHGGGYHRASYDPGTGAKDCDCRGMTYKRFCCHSDAIETLYNRHKLPDQE